MGDVACMGEMKTKHNFFIEKLQGKLILRRTKHTLVNNIKINLLKLGWEFDPFGWK